MMAFLFVSSLIIGCGALPLAGSAYRIRGSTGDGAVGLPILVMSPEFVGRHSELAGQDLAMCMHAGSGRPVSLIRLPADSFFSKAGVLLPPGRSATGDAGRCGCPLELPLQAPLATVAATWHSAATTAEPRCCFLEAALQAPLDADGTAWRLLCRRPWPPLLLKPGQGGWAARLAARPSASRDPAADDDTNPVFRRTAVSAPRPAPEGNAVEATAAPGPGAPAVSEPARRHLSGAVDERTVESPIISATPSGSFDEGEARHALHERPPGAAAHGDALPTVVADQHLEKLESRFLSQVARCGAQEARESTALVWRPRR